MYGTEILLICLVVLALAGRLIEKFKTNLSSEVRRAKEENSKLKNSNQNTKLFYLIFAILLFSGLSIFWAGDKTLAFYYWLKLFEGVGLFWLIANSSRLARLPTRLDGQARGWLAYLQGLTGRPADKFKLALIASGLIQALFGLYQFLTLSSFSSKWLGLAVVDPRIPGTSVIEFLDQRWLRAYGSLPHPNILGGWLAVCLLLVVLGLFQLNKKIARQQIISKQEYALNIFYWFSAVIIFAGLVVSFSRSAWLGFGLGFGYLLFYALLKKLKTEKTALLKLSAVFIVVFTLFTFSFPYQLITTRFSFTEPLEKYSLDQRLAGYLEAKQLLEQQPVLGAGIGNYTKILQKLVPAKPGWYYQPVHNWYWLALTELGLVGFLLFAFLIFSLFKRADSFSRTLLIALLVMGLFDHYLWSLYFGVCLWWLIWGLTYNSRK